MRLVRLAAAVFASALFVASQQKLAYAQKVAAWATEGVSADAIQLPQQRPSSRKSFRLNVFVPEGVELPRALVEKPMAQSRYGGKRLSIDSTSEDDVKAVLESLELHVELERPKVIPLETQMNPFNLEARISHRVPQFEATFNSKKGKTITAAVFDGGLIRASHQEFSSMMMSRIEPRTMRPLSDHATHVAGTIGAKGVNVEASGMAREIRIFSYDFFGDDLGLLEQDGSQFQVSNHSYGPYSGWHPGGPFGGFWHWWGGEANTEDPKFGKYTDQESRLDEILVKHPHLATFVAAGNDRGQLAKGPANQPVSHKVVLITPVSLQAMNSTKVRSLDGGQTGLDTVTGLGLAKNAICIGAVDDIPAAAANSAIQFTTFTGFGPADDGRIKPDLVANGFQLFSTAETGDQDYIEMSGTSMACPTSCGIGALLSEHFAATKGRVAASVEIKAALIHTARDAGVVGPDPQYGWGAIDTLQAGKVIASEAGQFVGDLSTNAAQVGVAKSFKMVPTSGPVRVTIAWLDPPGAPNGGGVDDPSPALINDLDLSVVPPNGTPLFPYSLDASNIWNVANGQPALAHTDRANRVDNVEVVDAPSASGEWKIEVRAASLKQGTSQSFVLIVSGLKPVQP